MNDVREGEGANLSGLLEIGTIGKILAQQVGAVRLGDGHYALWVEHDHPAVKIYQQVARLGQCVLLQRRVTTVDDIQVGEGGQDEYEVGHILGQPVR